MSPGDFVLTPSGTIHDHGNDSKKSMIWLDVLDVPTVNFFETCFYEHFDYERQNTRATTATRWCATARACCRTARRTATARS